jgi:protein involved in polysaccharide export with SLBB domain/predicted  nucleic acid-binding Zn-ribbon protein
MLAGLPGVGSAAPAAYTLGPGDQLRVKVYEWRSAVGDVHEWSALNGEFGVAADGNVSLPLVGSVPAAGRTVDELAATIAARLQQAMGLATPPQPSVEVFKYRPFYILGTVGKPGEYPYRPGMTVLHAISIAGGLFRVNDPGLLMAQRGTLTTAGDLQVLQADNNALMARRARLRAELDGAGKIAFPNELLQQQGDPGVAKLTNQEQAIFASRRDAFRSETDALNRLKDLLNGEVVSLQSKIKNVDQQLTLLKSELATVSSLVQRGLAPSPREFSMRQTELQTEAQRLDLDTATLRAREEIGKADQAIIELTNKTRNAALAELSEVEGKLAQTASRIKTNRAILEQEGAGPDVSALLNEQLAPPIYSIIRRVGEDIQKLAATEGTVVEPGDTIEVKRGGGGPVLATGGAPALATGGASALATGASALATGGAPALATGGAPALATGGAPAQAGASGASALATGGAPALAGTSGASTLATGSAPALAATGVVSPRVPTEDATVETPPPRKQRAKALPR